MTNDWRLLQPINAQVQSKIAGVPPKNVNILMFYCTGCTARRYEYIGDEIEQSIARASGMMEDTSL